MENETAKSREGSPETAAEKSPLESSDYAGLQLDTEAQERNRREDGGDRPRSMMKSAAYPYREHTGYGNEKGFEAGGSDEESPPRPAPSYEPPIPKIDGAMKETLSPDPERTTKDRRICGLNRLKLIILLVTVLIIVIVAAVVGGVVGSRNAAGSSTSLPAPSTTVSSRPTVTPTTDPGAVNGGLPKSDIMVASPLVPVAFSQNASGNASPIQTYSLFFQTVNGNIKQSIRGAGAVNTDWQSPAPIFTDAHNNSGLAAISYLNRSEPQMSLFYTGADSTLWEKRLYVGTSIWEIGTLTNSHWPVSGNTSFVGDGGWNGFRMAAAYSTNFSTGPGARLFYHGGNASMPWIQEIVWNHQNDSWRMGASIFGADPTSHLTATIEPASLVLRLFYSSGSGTVEEQWVNMTAPNATYQRGLSVPSLLANTTSDMAAVSTNNSTFLYYASSPSAGANVSIRELALSPQPGSTASTSSSLVAMPDLLADDTDRTVPSAFAPLSAVLSTLDGGQRITVLWADGVADPKSGYGALRATSRATNATWGDVRYGQAQGMVEVPLGDNNANPS